MEHGEGTTQMNLNAKSQGSKAAKRSEEHTSELQSQSNLVCRLLLEKKKSKNRTVRLPSRSTSSTLCSAHELLYRKNRCPSSVHPYCHSAMCTHECTLSPLSHHMRL